MAADLADGTSIQQSYTLLIRMLPGTTCLTYDGYATKRDVRHFLSLLLCVQFCQLYVTSIYLRGTSSVARSVLLEYSDDCSVTSGRLYQKIDAVN